MSGTAIADFSTGNLSQSLKGAFIAVNCSDMRD